MRFLLFDIFVKYIYIKVCLFSFAIEFDILYLSICRIYVCLLQKAKAKTLSFLLIRLGIQREPFSNLVVLLNIIHTIFLSICLSLHFQKCCKHLETRNYF